MRHGFINNEKRAEYQQTYFLMFSVVFCFVLVQKRTRVNMGHTLVQKVVFQFHRKWVKSRCMQSIYSSIFFILLSLRKKVIFFKRVLFESISMLVL